MRQFGGTCGYFALVNAINFIIPKDKALGYKDVEKLLKTTIQKGHSNIGEIFHYANFDSIVKEFRNLNKQINFEHEFVSFNKDLVYSLCEHQAIVVNYSSTPQEREGFFSNSHWVAIVKAKKTRLLGKTNKVTIINSMKMKKEKIDDICAAVKILKDKKFDWVEFLNSKGFKKYYMRKRRFTRHLNQYISEIGLNYKKKMDDIEYQKEHAIIEHDHSKCLLLTF